MKIMDNSHIYARRLREIEQAAYAIVKPIIDKHDIQGLLKIGCPEDEYDSLSKSIAEAIVREGGNRVTVEELGNLLTFAFHQDFQPWTEPVNYHVTFQLIAAELHPLLPDTLRLRLSAVSDL